MGKDKNSNSRTQILLIGTVSAAVILLIVLLFGFFDLGHRIVLLTYTKISTYEDLKAIANKPDGKYCLASDIDMAGKDWTPFTFNGTLDGDGHAIKNLSLTKKGGAVRDTYDGNLKSYQTSLVGLFDVIENATITNLTLSSVYVEYDTDEPCFAGTIAGYMGNSKIVNCAVQGDVYLRAHEKMFGVGGVAGYGFGLFDNVQANVTLVCIDTDRTTKDEQFMGGLIGAGYPDILRCAVDIDGYVSEHGYVHNGGMIGLYMFYPEGTTHKGQIAHNRTYGKITFFEDNDDRRAYCSAIVGEMLDTAEVFEDNAAGFRSVEVYNYDADLLPGEHSEVYSFDAKESGRFDLKASYKNAGEDATYGLFINGRFYKKVSFPKGEGTVDEAIFLEAGKNEVKFRFLPGDGNITFSDVSVKESKKQVSLIVAPHQDDEILAFAGTIQQELKKGNDVKVLFLTTGDYYGTEFTPIRLAESVEALAVLGLDKSDITVLGYGDLTLEALLSSEDPDKCFQSRSGKTSTYGDPVQNLYDYHTLNTGDPADFTGANLRNDLSTYLLACRPDRIYTTSEFEWHTDHAFGFRMVKEILQNLSKEAGYRPVLCESVIHGEEDTWPEHLTYGSDNKPVIKEFSNPFPTKGTSLDWSKVKKIVLTDEEVSKKSEAISKFVSQNEGTELYPGTGDYTAAFCKRDEFYWEITY
jgi:LmbE family N-acetylglucosaminyl deacetylase